MVNLLAISPVLLTTPDYKFRTFDIPGKGRVKGGPKPKALNVKISIILSNAIK